MSTESYLRELRWKEINALRAENERLREFIRVLIVNEPDDMVADGVTVLMAWRKDARAALRGEKNGKNERLRAALTGLIHAMDENPTSLDTLAALNSARAALNESAQNE